ncbi:tumor necrosis factor receptor superfamily member 1A isoform X2 [Denticeps clupeoides]|uniref:tumor necrosis factor receptor superfamily member 1A isoform X2 n=1 Tax=Denticeps clupeoides TaxID=299321 RepID=UPI0010A4B98A|nr:tumor necrosis factor receptor superfamily member 1A isoform X2 [Denticeps clupeoides]
MDGARARGTWEKEAGLCTLLLLALLVQTQAIPKALRPPAAALNCSSSEYLHSDAQFCCNKCPAGHKLVSQCQSSDHRTICTKCEKGTFLLKANSSPRCSSCRRCKELEDVVSPCTHDGNTVCRCKQGYYGKPKGSDSQQCLICKTCGPGERVTGTCTPVTNTVCQCKDFHYRVNPTTCEPCQTCSDECLHLCQITSDPVTKTSEQENMTAAIVVIVVLLVFAVAGIVPLFKTIVPWCKKHLAKYPESSDPPNGCSEPAIFTSVCEDFINNTNESIPLPSPTEHMESDCLLPDCVPKEINVIAFIYSALDVVPAARFTELVRRLSVSDREIERAERDKHTFYESQYQMLKVWTNGKTREGESILPQHALKEFLDILDEMGLSGCGQKLESKYSL